MKVTASWISEEGIPAINEAAKTVNINRKDNLVAYFQGKGDSPDVVTWLENMDVNEFNAIKRIIRETGTLETKAKKLQAVTAEMRELGLVNEAEQVEAIQKPKWWESHPDAPSGRDFEVALGDLPKQILATFKKHGIYCTEDPDTFEAAFHTWLTDMAADGIFSKEAGHTDPAGGFHPWGEKDPAKQYE